MPDRFQELEDSVLEMLLAGEEPVLTALRNQLGFLVSKRREMTGAGFFTFFSFLPGAPRLLDPPALAFGDVFAEIEGLKFGGGFLLFVSDGLLDMLEGYTYGEESWPSEITNFKLNYSNGPQRNIEALRKTPGWPLDAKRRG